MLQVELWQILRDHTFKRHLRITFPNLMTQTVNICQKVHEEVSSGFIDLNRAKILQAVPKCCEFIMSTHYLFIDFNGLRHDRDQLELIMYEYGSEYA